jgi:DnaJ-class molecular chaperone
MTQEDNLYQILGVGPSSSQEEIKQAYRRLSMEHHPDRGGDSAKFNKVKEAFNVLSDQAKRNRYDMYINVVKISEDEVKEYHNSKLDVEFNVRQGMGSVSIEKIK